MKLTPIIRDYEIVAKVENTLEAPLGFSLAPKEMIFHIYDDLAPERTILDIGFGTGGLGELVKSFEKTKHWHIDGVDGWFTNCQNKELFNKQIYRNIWHGLAQDLSFDDLRKYDVICLLDVIEHLTSETAKYLLRNLLSAMSPEAKLFISTPLWFMPQHPIHTGDLEEHLIGVPATSLMALIPEMYAVRELLVGGFIYSKKSLDYIELFQPTSDKSFSIEKGLKVAQYIGMKFNDDNTTKIIKIRESEPPPLEAL